MIVKMSQSKILLVSAFVCGFAALFTLIGLTTPKWVTRGFGLWNCNSVCSTSAAALTIIALFFAVISSISVILILAQMFPRFLRFLPVVLMSITTIFLIAAIATYLRSFASTGYSFELIIVALCFSFLASTLLAFWFGRVLEDKPMSVGGRT